MLKRFLGSVVVAGALLIVPVTVESSDSGLLSVSFAEACAEGGNCCPAPGWFCVAGGDPLINYRYIEECSAKPGT